MKTYPTPVWEVVGMDYYDFKQLPWEKRRLIIRRAWGIRVNDTCAGCGHRLDLMAEKRRREELAPELRDHPYGLLIQAYFDHNAEDMAIFRNYPHASLSCGHTNPGGRPQ